MGKVLSSLRTCIDDADDAEYRKHGLVPARILQHPNARYNIQSRSPPWLVYRDRPSDSEESVHVIQPLPSPLGAPLVSLVDPKIAAVVQTETVLIPDISLSTALAVNIILPAESEETPLLAAPATPTTILLAATGV